MGEGIIVRRGGGGGEILPVTGFLLEVITPDTSYIEYVSIAGDNLSMTIPRSDARALYRNSDAAMYGSILADRYAFLFPFHIPASWVEQESAKAASSSFLKFNITITVHSTGGDTSILVKPSTWQYQYQQNRLPNGSVFTQMLPNIEQFLYRNSKDFGLNPMCTITNNNAYTLAKAYDSSNGRVILLGPAGNSVNADLVTGTSGGISYSIPGDTFYKMYVSGYANGTTGKVGLYDNNGTKQAEISLDSSLSSKDVLIPSGTGNLRLNIVGKDVHISEIYFEHST